MKETRRQRIERRIKEAYAKGRRDEWHKWMRLCGVCDEEHDAKVRADAIDDVIKKLAESEDTILTDKQYYTLMEMKEQKNE